MSALDLFCQYCCKVGHKPMKSKKQSYELLVRFASLYKETEVRERELLHILFTSVILFPVLGTAT